MLSWRRAMSMAGRLAVRGRADELGTRTVLSGASRRLEMRFPILARSARCPVRSSQL